MNHAMHSLGALLALVSVSVAARQSNVPEVVKVDLNPTLSPSALVDIASGGVPIRGTVADQSDQVLVRVTTSDGQQAERTVAVSGGAFSCQFPQDFDQNLSLAPGALFIDATTDGRFEPSKSGAFQAEAALLLFDSKRRLGPNLPAGLLTGIRDAQGKVDTAAEQWPAVRTVVNLFMRSRAALITKVGAPKFDLATPAGLERFKSRVSLFEFAQRDRDWSMPLNHRLAPTFWLASAASWFGASNDHAVGIGTDKRYPPYTFTNDHADLLITYLLRPRGAVTLGENVDTVCDEGVKNLLALQHRDTTNFAAKDAKGRLETFTAGAFRYGLFDDGQFMTEGTGWFNDPGHNDYTHGGVFNGRATWALGLALKRSPEGPMAKALRDAITSSIGFCLRDSKPQGYSKRTKQNHVYWRDVGEHGYLLLGMMAACSVDPTMAVPDPNGPGKRPLKEVCAEALNALVDLKRPSDQWTIYPNVDSIAIAALVDGADILRQHADAAKWRSAAVAGADRWMAAKVDPKEYSGPLVHFGPLLDDGRMTFNWRHLSPREPDENRIVFYMSGHWMHALARLYTLTGDVRYRTRCEALITYMCGQNPWHVRLFNELGGVYNWVTDTDGDGKEDSVRNDMYPESTAFCQIGIVYLADALARGGK